jgi:hypothetical protein
MGELSMMRVVYGRVVHRINFNKPNFSWSNLSLCPTGKLSKQASFCEASCPLDELSIGRVVHGAISA